MNAPFTVAKHLDLVNAEDYDSIVTESRINEIVRKYPDITPSEKVIFMLYNEYPNPTK